MHFADRRINEPSATRTENWPLLALRLPNDVGSYEHSATGVGPRAGHCSLSDCPATVEVKTPAPGVESVSRTENWPLLALRLPSDVGSEDPSPRAERSVSRTEAPSEAVPERYERVAGAVMSAGPLRRVLERWGNRWGEGLWAGVHGPGLGWNGLAFYGPPLLAFYCPFISLSRPWGQGRGWPSGCWHSDRNGWREVNR